jgi:hypothetical protein
MMHRLRQILGTIIAAIIVFVIAVIIWLIPWKNIGRFLDKELDERPAWVRADGQIYKIALFPELFEAIGSEYGGDGKFTFAVPKIEEYDYLANDRFGATTLYRCIATRKLEDNSPTATLGWCER